MIFCLKYILHIIILLVNLSVRLASLMEVIRPPQAENNASERIASGSSSSSAHIQHGMLQVQFINY